MHVHLYDYRWVDEHTTQWQATAQGRFGRKNIAVGQDLSVQVVGERHCAGHLTDRGWGACQSVTHEPRAKCQLCRSLEGSFIYTVFDGFDTSHVSAVDLEKLDVPHVVYLAYFTDEMMKIGVSKAERSRLRQIEQGSLATKYIAECKNGVHARQIETLARQSGLADKISASQKRAFLVPDITPAQAEARLQALQEGIPAVLGAGFEHLREQLTDGAYVWWGEHYGLGRVAGSPKAYHALKLAVDESVSGRVLALRGQFVFLETDTEIIALNAKDLRGYMLDFSPLPAGTVLGAALQGALF